MQDTEKELREVAAIGSGAVQSKIIWGLFLFFLALGIFSRVYGLGERNLWTDEAWVALAAVQPSPGEALRAGKSTPPLYLLTVWGTVQIWGRSEAVLRLTSCLLGVGTLLLMWPLARMLLPPGSALTAFALSSVSYRLVYFSKELKQYSADIFFAALIFFLVERQLRRQGRDGWVRLTALLGAGLGFSHALVFLMPAAAPVLWWKLPERRRAVLASFTALGLIFLGYYWFFFRSQVDPELLVYWQCDFPDLTCGSDFACWLGGGLSRFGKYFFADWGALPGLVVVVSGLFFFYWEGKARVLWYLGGPMLAALAAAFAERYPFMGHAGGVRLMMFMAPVLYLVTGAGIGAISGWLWRRENPPAESSGGRKQIFDRAGFWKKAAGILLAAAVLFWVQPVKLWQENLCSPDNLEEIEPLVSYLERHRQPADAIYVYYFAKDPFRYYYDGSPENIVWGTSCHEAGLAPERLQEVERLWLIFSHFETRAFVDSFVRNLLGAGWTKERELSQPGALLFCYLPPWRQPAVIPPAP